MTRLLHILVWLSAAIFTPAAMFLGYVYAGTLSAVQFRIVDLWDDYSAALVTALLLLISVFFWTRSTKERAALAALWIIRTGVALGAMLPYEALYLSDANSYYLLGLVYGPSLEAFEFGNGTKNVMFACGLLSELTTSYHAMKLVFSYVGLLSIFIFYRAIRLALGRELIPVLYVLGLFPSILFWTSILGKEPIVVLGVSIYALGVVHFFRGRSALGFLLIVVGVLIAASIRVWLGPIFLSSFIAAVVLLGRLNLAAKAAIVAVSVPVFIVALGLAADSFRIETAEDLVTRTDDLSRSWAHGGSAQTMVPIGSVSDMLLFLPLGAFTALFRPLPGEILNPFGLVAGLENGLILLLLIRGLMVSGIGWIREPVLCWVVLTLLAWSSVYGFVSYQNLGTAFRFKVQVAPFLVALVLILNFWRHLIPDRAVLAEAERADRRLDAAKGSGA